MARKKLTDEEKLIKYEKERLEREYKESIEKLEFCPEPTYFFQIGDKVALGNLQDVTVIEVYEGGKFYKLNYSVTHNNYGNPYTEHGKTRFEMWYNIRPIVTSGESIIQNSDIQLNFATTHIGDILSKAYYFGLDMNPDYQRDFVWEEKDKVALIDSIFSNIEIGKFCFVHHNYGDKYLYEVLDGKQRIRAILDFYENRFAYKGKYYNDLLPLDKHWFEQYTISSATVNNVNKKAVLKYFLLLNRSGKKMDEKQLNNVQKMYDSM